MESSAQWTAASPAENVESARMRRMLTEVLKYFGSSPGASARISQGAARITAAETSERNQTKQRESLRKRAVRSSPWAAVNMGTKAKTMLLISTELKVSRGPR